MVSFARGLGAVGASPVLLITLFIVVLVLWLAYTSYGAGLAASSPLGLVEFMSLPPIRTFFDLDFLAVGHLTAGGAIAFAVGIVVLRALSTAFLISAVDLTLRSAGSWRTVLGGALRRMLAAFWIVLTIEVGFVAASLFVHSISLVLGAQSTLLDLAWVIAGMYFFAYCEIVAVLERAPLRAALVWGVRAARVPGREHALLVFSYAVLIIIVPNFAPGRSLVSATPTVSVWAYALVVSVLHVGMLGAFAWRWNLLAEPVKAGAGSRTSRPARPSLFSAGGSRRGSR